jgi:hypothetical protein
MRHSNWNAVATGRNAASKLSFVEPAGHVMAIRIKNRPVASSPYCELSTMLQSWLAIELATAATIPLRSSQTINSTKSAPIPIINPHLAKRGTA